MKILFFGTPSIAVPFLQWLIEHESVIGVVCRPDEPAGRGHKITAPPAKTLALEKNIPVFQPVGPWTSDLVASLKKTDADIGIVVAYGRIMPDSVLNAPKRGCVNLHFSLLPHYRGAAPMQWALINGDAQTGVTAFWLDAKMDEGPIFHQAPVSISADDNLPLLRDKLTACGRDILARVMADLKQGNEIRTPQMGAPTLAPMLKKEMGEIKWTEPAVKISNLIRGIVEWPGASTHYTPKGAAAKRLKVLKARAMSGGRGTPGKILEIKKDAGILVQTGDGHLLLQDVQPEGKKPMAASAFWLGAQLQIGDTFE